MAKNNPFKTPLPKRRQGRGGEKPSMGPLSPVKGLQLDPKERLTIEKTQKQNKRITNFS